MKTNYKRLESNSVQNLLNLNDPEPAFYYLTDHLGSTSYIVNDSAQITQKLAYMPFGEDFVDLNYNTPYPPLTPFRFNGKEKDEETGFNYFGARYYYDYLSIWLSVDPLMHKYPHLSPYVYCANNPLKYIDPNGMEIWITGDDGNKYTYKNQNLYDKDGNKYEGKDKFANTTLNHLNSLRENGMKDEITQLETSKNIHNIIKGVDNTWRPDNDIYASDGKTGTGSQIQYNLELQNCDN